MRPLTISSLFLVTAVALFCAPVIQAQMQMPVYINVTAGCNQPNRADIKAGYAIGMTIGIALYNNHIEGELLLLKNDLTYRDGTGGIQQIPILVTYRRQIPFGASRWALQAGGSIGISHERIPDSDNCYYHNNLRSKWGMTYGGQVIVVYKVNSTVSVNAGLRFIYVDNKKYLTDPLQISRILTLGTSFRF